MKEWFRKIISILAAAILCITLAMQPAMQTASAEAAQTAASAPESGHPEENSILAEKVEWAQLREGDRFYIVIRAGDRAISLNQKKTRLDWAAVTVGQTATRQVLTDVGEGAALFEIAPAGDGSVYFKCDNGYLTTSEDGRSLFYTQTPGAGSRWQSDDGEILTHADMLREGINGGLPNRVYIEYYTGGGYFGSFWSNGTTDVPMLVMDFYRAGNSKPEETVLKENLYYLPVFETSDLHGILADTNGDKPQYRVAYISDKVKDIRGYEPNTRKELAVLLDGGDIFQGTTVSSVTNGHALSAAFDLMGYDAVTVGNHEFDWGLDTVIDPDGTLMDYSVKQFVGENKIPVVIANLYKNGEKIPGVKDYVILDKTARDAEGNEMPVKIGVIGMADDYEESVLYENFIGAGYSISLDYDAINALAEELESGGQCDATILLAHGKAVKAAERLGDKTAIDLVLGGHKHSEENWRTTGGLLYMAPAGKAGTYEYCEMAFAEENGSPVFRKACNNRSVYTKTGLAEMAEKGREAEELDPEIVMLTDTAIQAVDNLLGAEVGYITVSAKKNDWFPGSGGRSSALGNWVCSITARIAGTEIAMNNSGGIRTGFPIPEGNDSRIITLQDIYEMLALNNEICVFEITWDELEKVLTYSLTKRGKLLFTEGTGFTCYYTNKTVQAILNDDEETVYDHGIWKDGWKEKKVRIAIVEFLATADRTDADSHLSNPFCEWINTDRFIGKADTQIEGAIRVLTQEAMENDGHLAIDTRPHFINRDYEPESR